METGKAIYKLLKDSTDVGDICADRIYPELAQQDADAPFIVYTVVDTTPSPTKNATSKLDTARVELYCLSDDYEQAMDLGIAVRSALDRQSGTISGVEVQSIDFDTSDIQFDPDQRIYVLEHTYDVRVQRTGTAQVVSQFPGNTFTVEEVDGDPTGAVNKLVVSNGTLTIDGNTGTIDTAGAESFTELSDTPGTLGTAGQIVAVNSGGTALEFVDQETVDTQYHGRYDTEAETLRSGATGDVEFYYTARPDGDGTAESEISDEGETDTINRTLAYSTKHRADPDTVADWTDYTTQPADNASFATAKAALLAGLNETDATAETRGTLPVSLKMTRTTTAVSQDLLLDTYSGAAAAYSVRKLSKDYTGNCMRIRRDSDQATQDIGFDGNGDLDVSAIETFCSGSFGYCTRWYDQSGNGNDMTQNTASSQPIIYDRVAAAVVTENGQPCIEFVSSDILNTGTFNGDPQFTQPTTWFWTINKASHSNYLFDDYGGIGRQAQGNGTWVFAGTVANNFFPSADLNQQRLFTLLFDGASSISRMNGSATGSGNPGTNGSRGISFNSSDLKVQEIVVYNADQTSNFTGIETDINDYFSIYS